MAAAAPMLTGITFLAALVGVLFVLLPLILVGAAIAFVVRRLSDRADGSPRRDSSAAPVTLPYRKKDYLLTRAERSFYSVLQAGVGADYLIFPKVRLADLVWLPKGTGRRMAHFNRVSAKHIDFVLCDANTVSPVLAIELDDRSHERPDRQARDTFLDNVFRAAGLPVLHVPARSGYSAEDLTQRVRTALAASTPVTDAVSRVVRANTHLLP